MTAQKIAEDYAVRRLQLFQAAISAATQQSLLEDNIELGPSSEPAEDSSNAPRADGEKESSD